MEKVSGLSPGRSGAAPRGASALVVRLCAISVSGHPALRTRITMEAEGEAVIKVSDLFSGRAGAAPHGASALVVRLRAISASGYPLRVAPVTQQGREMGTVPNYASGCRGFFPGVHSRRRRGTRLGEMQRLCWRHCLRTTKEDEFCRQSGIEPGRVGVAGVIPGRNPCSRYGTDQSL